MAVLQGFRHEHLAWPERESVGYQLLRNSSAVPVAQAVPRQLLLSMGRVLPDTPWAVSQAQADFRKAAYFCGRDAINQHWRSGAVGGGGVAEAFDVGPSDELRFGSCDA
eukprot:15455353-Alexandrium_andersonii.AAC.1